MYICTVKLAGVLIDPTSEEVMGIVNIRADVDYNEFDYGRGFYTKITIYDQFMKETGMDIVDWRYTQPTQTFKELLREYATSRWSGKNGAYRFEELKGEI